MKIQTQPTRQHSGQIQKVNHCYQFTLMATPITKHVVRKKTNIKLK